MLYCIIYCLNKNKSAKTQTKISIANNASKTELIKQNKSYETQNKLKVKCKTKNVR